MHAMFQLLSPRRGIALWKTPSEPIYVRDVADRRRLTGAGSQRHIRCCTPPAGAGLSKARPQQDAAPFEVQRLPIAATTSADSSGIAVEAASDQAPAAVGGHGGRLPEVQLTLPPPENVRVKTSRYLSSSVKHSDCPPPLYAEFAIIGRSNVGKSSLINMLTGNPSLAKVSKSPGKTRCINHFIINSSWYLVDLPGYGYARVGKGLRAGFDSFTKEYFKQRPSLGMVLLLVDSTIPPQDIDLEYARWLAEKQVGWVGTARVCCAACPAAAAAEPSHSPLRARACRALFWRRLSSRAPACCRAAAGALLPGVHQGGQEAQGVHQGAEHPRVQAGAAADGRAGRRAAFIRDQRRQGGGQDGAAGLPVLLARRHGEQRAAAEDADHAQNGRA